MAEYRFKEASLEDEFLSRFGTNQQTCHAKLPKIVIVTAGRFTLCIHANAPFWCGDKPFLLPKMHLANRKTNDNIGGTNEV
jgi:hypothetical protein